MKNKDLFKKFSFIGLAGVAVLLVSILLNSSFHGVSLKLITPLGMIIVLIGLVGVFVNWLLLVKDAIVSKNYRLAASLVLTGIFIILLQFVRKIFN